MTILILVAVILLPQVFGGGEDEVTVVAASPQAAQLARAAARADDAFDVRIVPRAVASDAQARRLLREGDARRRDRRRAAGGWSSAAARRTAAWRRSRPPRASSAPRTPCARAAPTRPTPGASSPRRRCATASIDEDADARQAFAFVALIVLYGQLISYGIWVATGVVEEKTSRIVEILLATIRPRELLVGQGARHRARRARAAAVHRGGRGC